MHKICHVQKVEKSKKFDAVLSGGKTKKLKTKAKTLFIGFFLFFFNKKAPHFFVLKLCLLSLTRLCMQFSRNFNEIASNSYLKRDG